MGSYQGLIGRKLLPDIGQAMAMASGSSSSPSPFCGHLEMKPITSLIALIVAIFFLIGFLLVQFLQCYAHRGQIGHVRTVLYDIPEPTQGLDVSVLQTLPKAIFSSSVQAQQKEKNQQTMECVICLEEFEDQETLGLLPQCGHGFHLECINMWFFSHTTCPLCRHSVLHPNTIAIAIDVPSPNDGSIAANSVPAEALQIRVPENPSEEGESSENRAQLRRCQSMGHSVVKVGLKLPASSSSPLLSFIVHRSSSCTLMSDLAKTSEGS